MEPFQGYQIYIPCKHNSTIFYVFWVYLHREAYNLGLESFETGLFMPLTNLVTLWVIWSFVL